MPRKAKWPPPIYKHKQSGKERMRVWIDGKPKDIPLGPIDSDEARTEYRRQLALIEANGGRYPGEAPRPPEGLTVEQVLAAFVVHLERDRGDDWSQLDKYRAAFRPLLALYRHHPAASIDSDVLELLQRAMACGSWMTDAEKAAHVKYQWPIDWARSQVNRSISRIKAAWQWAEAKKHIPKGSYAHLLSVKNVTAGAVWCRSTPRRRPTSRADLDKVLPYCPAPIAAMLELQWWAGMRSGEVRTMRLGELDRTGKVWSYLPSVDKNAWRGEPTAPIALGPECRKILAPWIAAAPSGDAYLFRPLLGRRRKDGQVLAADPDCCYSERAYPQAVDRACTKAGVKILPYGGRHAAKQRITREAGADAARAVLRQRSIVSTTHYGDIDVEHAKDVMDKLG